MGTETSRDQNGLGLVEDNVQAQILRGNGL